MMNITTLEQKIRTSLLVLLLIWIGVLLFTVLEGLSGLLTLHEYRLRVWQSLCWVTLYHWLPWFILTPLVLAIAEKLPVHPGNWKRAIPLHVLLLLTLSVLHGLMTSYLYVWVGFVTPDMLTYESWQHAGHFLFGERMLVFDCMIYIALIAILNIQAFYSQLRQKEIDSARMGGQLSEAKLNALRAQINPHFLFNTLNSIAVLVRKNDTTNANTMIEKLSGFFRQTLESSGDHWVPLRQEMDIIRNYLDIEKIRIGERLQIVFEIDRDALGVEVPMMITQPLVENAVKHGIAKKTGNCELKIEARIRNRHLYLRISDNGAGHDFHAMDDCRKGIGIANVRERLKQTYGTDLGVRIDGVPGKGVIATLELPVERDAAEAAPA